MILLPKQSTSMEVETQNRHSLRYLNSTIKGVNTLPWNNRQIFQRQLKKHLSHIFADSFPCHLMPSCRSLSVLVMPVWKTYTSQMKYQSRVAVTMPEDPQKVLQNELQSCEIKTRKGNWRNKTNLDTGIDLMGRLAGFYRPFWTI